MMMGVETGDMPEVDYIWEVQHFDGHEACFGRGVGCVNLQCRWRQSCLSLSFYINRRRSRPLENLPFPETHSVHNINRINRLHPSLTESSHGKNS